MRELYESNFIGREEFISKQRPLIQNALTLISTPSSTSDYALLVTQPLATPTHTPVVVTPVTLKEDAEDTKEATKKQEEAVPPAEKEKEIPSVLCSDCPSLFPEHRLAEVLLPPFPRFHLPHNR